MKRIANTKSFSRTIFVGLFSLVSAVLLGSTLNTREHSAETLEFFRVVDDKSVYDKQPKNFEVMVLKSRGDSYARYVERTPSLRIGSTEINSVLIEKVKVHAGSKGIEEIVRETLDPKLKKDNRDFPFGYVYKATFHLTQKAGKMFNDFASNYSEESFDFRFGTNRLAIVQFIGPFARKLRVYCFS